jgi:uncharacterized C2H2 Zn-finger protein
MNQTIQCKRCKKPFSTASNLDKHLKKTRDCMEIIKCEKCDTIFKYKSELRKHVNRKTSCTPIKGKPTNQTSKNACDFCNKKLSSTQSIQRHYNVCKIKNGGISLLFRKVELLEKEMKEHITKDIGIGIGIGYVYFINMENTTKFKIGYTKKEPKKRMSNLQIGCPSKLVLFKFIICDDPYKLEQYLHECFAENNIRGEWYDMKHEDIEDICEFLKMSG